MVGPETAGASWGHRAPYCSKGEGHHCYAISSASINAWASIGLQDTHFSTVYDCASGGFVSNEMWVEPESKDEGWLEVGQIVGYGYCDQVPHLFYAELSPTNRNVFHIMVSTAAVPSQSYNWYAISDIPEHNGRWHIYYSSPPGYTGWNNWGRIRWRLGDHGEARAGRHGGCHRIASLLRRLDGDGIHEHQHRAL
jgi:hypothetical protein